MLAFANVYNPLLAGRGPLSAINEGAAFAFFTTKITHTHKYTHTQMTEKSLTEDSPIRGRKKKAYG